MVTQLRRSCSRNPSLLTKHADHGSRTGGRFSEEGLEGPVEAVAGAAYGFVASAAASAVAAVILAGLVRLLLVVVVVVLVILTSSVLVERIAI